MIFFKASVLEAQALLFFLRWSVFFTSIT